MFSSLRAGQGELPSNNEVEMQLKRQELARGIDEGVKRIDAKLASGSRDPEQEEALQAERDELELRG
jgi:hypothetical protein